MPEKKKAALGASLKRLEEIVGWFDTQDEVDVEVGLERVKEGADLVKVCRTRLRELENEFETVRKDLETSEKT